MLNISLLVNGISYFYFQNSIFFMCILIFSHFENIMYFMLFIINELCLLGKGRIRHLLNRFLFPRMHMVICSGWVGTFPMLWDPSALRLQLYNIISDMSIYDDLFWESENNILHCNSIFYCTKCTSIFTKKKNNPSRYIVNNKINIWQNNVSINEIHD